MTRRITTQIEQWVEEALEDQSLGDRVTWDCSFAMTPEGPKMLMVFFLPGAILGSAIQTVVMLDHVNAATELDITETVKNVLEDLRSNRSKQTQMEEPAGGPLRLLNGLGG